MCLINFPLQLKIIVGACFLYRRAIIYFFGWHAISKAVELSGSSVGGCELVVKALPVPKRNLGPPPPPSLPFWLYYPWYIT